MTPLAAAQAEVDQVTDIMKDNVGKVRKTFIAADWLNTNAGSMMGFHYVRKSL